MAGVTVVFALLLCFVLPALFNLVCCTMVVIKIGKKSLLVSVILLLS